MKKISIITLACLPLFLSAQLFEGEDYKYNYEIIWGLNKNTNGGLIGGLMSRYSRSRGTDLYETFGVEFSNVKHPSEVRLPSEQGQFFTYGKTNYLYSVRLQYGREKLMFKKATQQGVQISAGFAGGPTIGLLTPYYVLSSSGYEPFDPVTHPSPETVGGPGKLLQGLGESKINLGLNGKGSLSFEFGTYRSNVAGVEMGVLVEAFTKEMVIVPTQPNKSVFTSAFLTLFWGTRK